MIIRDRKNLITFDGEALTALEAYLRRTSVGADHIKEAIRAIF